jgi:hypothetical protein
VQGTQQAKHLGFFKKEKSKTEGRKNIQNIAEKNKISFLKCTRVLHILGGVIT